MIRNTSPKSLLRSLWHLVAEPLVVVTLVFVSTTAIAQPFYVPTGSMQPTLAIGDALIGAKFPYGFSRWSLPFGLGPKAEDRLFGKLPAHGDVVVFRLPRDEAVTYVKRVVGLPGDRIQMVKGELVINGKKAPLLWQGTAPVQDHNGVAADVNLYRETLPGGVTHTIVKHAWDGWLDNTPVFTVPQGHVFVMGDNRDNSLDSRASASMGGVGFVPVENLMARAEFTIGSYNFLNANGPASWPGLIRWERFFKAI
jgi:signal peptidase I